MQILLLGLALFQSPAPSQGYAERDYIGHGTPPLMITAYTAATNYDYVGHSVEVCGHVVGVYPDRNEAMMVGRLKWLMVDTRGRAQLAPGRAACVTGVIRRRDGLSEQERLAHGIVRTLQSQGPPGDIVLYQCHGPESCNRLMQRGPVRDEQLDTGASQAEPGQRG